MSTTRLSLNRQPAHVSAGVQSSNAIMRSRQRGTLLARGMAARIESKAQSVLKRFGNARSASAARKPMSDRRIRSGKGRERTSEKQIEEYFEALGDSASMHARKSLQEQCMNGDDPRHSARQWFDEVAEQYLALEWVLNTADWAKAPALRARLDDALAEFMAEDADAIRSATHSIRPAAEFAEQIGGGAKDVRALQSTYDDIVFDSERNLSHVLNRIVQKFPGRSLAEAIKAIRRALGDDLSSQRKSAADERLRLLVSDLYYVSVSTTALLACTQLAERLATLTESGAPTDEMLMRQIAHWTSDRWLPSSRVSELVNKLPRDATQARITLATGLRTITAGFPDQIFVDREHRFVLADAVQQVLDEVIDMESAELDAIDAVALAQATATEARLTSMPPAATSEMSGS